jgi:hypothetical protein
VKAVAHALLAALLLAAGVALADPRPEPRDPVALRRWRRGLALYAKQKYQEAIVQFWAGWALEPFRPFLFAWGQAERLSGDCDTAVLLYRRFLRERPPRDQAAFAEEGLKLCGRRR